MNAYCQGFIISLVVFGVLPKEVSSFGTASHSCLFRSAPASSTCIRPSVAHSQPKLPLQRNGSTKLQGAFITTAAAAADAGAEGGPGAPAGVARRACVVRRAPSPDLEDLSAGAVRASAREPAAPSERRIAGRAGGPARLPRRYCRSRARGTPRSR